MNGKRPPSMSTLACSLGFPWRSHPSTDGRALPRPCPGAFSWCWLQCTSATCASQIVPLPKARLSGASMPSMLPWARLFLKRQATSTAGDFLSLEHDLSRSRSSFWACDRIQTKLTDLIKTARSDNRLSPGTAAKMYGPALPASSSKALGGVWDEEGLRLSKSDHDLTPELHYAFEMLLAVVALRPRRVLEIGSAAVLRFAAASDAALGNPGQGARGFHLLASARRTSSATPTWHTSPMRSMPCSLEARRP